MLASSRIMWAVVAVAGLLFVGSVAALALRVAAYNRTAGFVRYSAVVEDGRETALPAYPKLRLTDALDESAHAALRLEFGPASRLIPVKAPAAKDLPTLAAYDEWVKVLAINEVVLDADSHSVAKPGTDRLLVVVRRTPDGFDPDTWGRVRRNEWLFDIYELGTDGSVRQTVRRWPRPEQRERELQAEAARSADPRIKAFAAIPPLEERSAEYFAALFVIPKLNVPQHKFSDTALNWKVLGWTLPTSMLSGLVLIPAVFFAVANRRPKAVG